MEVEGKRTKLHRLVAMGLRIQVMVVGIQVVEAAMVMVVVVESNRPAEEVNGKLGVEVVKETAEEGIGWAEVGRVMVVVGVHDILYTAAEEVGVVLYTAVGEAVNRPVEGEGENRQVEEAGEISKDRLEVEVNVEEEAASAAVVEESTMVGVVGSWEVAVNCSSKQVGVERTWEGEVGESLVVEVGVMVGRNTPVPVAAAMVGEEMAGEERVEVVVESKPGVVGVVGMAGEVKVEVGVESKPVGAAVGVMVVVEKAVEETVEVGVESKLAVVETVEVETAVVGMVEVEEESKQAGEGEMVMVVAAAAEGVVGKWDEKRIQVAVEGKQVAMVLVQQVAEKGPPQVAAMAPPQVATEQQKMDIQKNCNPQA